MELKELEKEAEVKAQDFSNNEKHQEVYRCGYLDGAYDRQNYIVELEKENAELTERLLKIENAYKKKFDDEWRLNDLYQRLRTDYANAEKCSM